MLTSVERDNCQKIYYAIIIGRFVCLMIFIINKSYNDMAKKETVKKTIAKKTTKKVAAKKVENIEEVVINEPVQIEEVVEAEKLELNYEDLYKESDKSVVVENEPENDKGGD